MKESGNCPLMLGDEPSGGGDGQRAGRQVWYPRSTCLRVEGLKMSPRADEGWGALPLGLLTGSGLSRPSGGVCTLCYFTHDCLRSHRKTDLLGPDAKEPCDGAEN